MVQSEGRLMKIIFLLIGIIASCRHNADSNPYSSEDWYKVLTCDQGAAVIDNRQVAAFNRGGERKFEAQIVIRDKNIIRYFNEERVVQSKLLDDELIAYGDNWQRDKQPLLDFSVLVQGDQDPNNRTKGFVRYERDTIYLQLERNGKTANWIFRSCVRK
jgi:hypothetical protein